MKGMAAVLCVAVCGILILPLLIASAYYSGDGLPPETEDALLKTESDPAETEDPLPAGTAAETEADPEEITGAGTDTLPVSPEETSDETADGSDETETLPEAETSAKETTLVTETSQKAETTPVVTAAVTTPPEKEPETPALSFRDTDIIKLYNTSTGKIERLTVAEYLYGVVLAEMPSYFNEEALKAQAVACRSYLYYRMLNITTTSSYHGGTDADICTNHAHCAAFISYDNASKKYGAGWADKIYPKIKAAVDATADEFVLYKGEVADTFFHSSSYLYTEDVRNVWGSTLYPYLVSVSSPENDDFVDIKTTVSVSAATLQKNVTKNGGTDFPEDKADWIEEINLNENGRVAEVTVCGVSFTGRDMRSLFGLRSTTFGVKYDKETDSFIFTVLGNGHGVGMSQHGANLLAGQGMKYKEILTHYYKGTTVGKLS